ncbi:hypothetical protein VZC37_02235 [Gordonia sp. LSe1-13]|uniref:Uncharacterized protein n=1 Tax=Gordonia sesuvii TaxID=3116777 RepID=A0ABU7M8J6_9ACTN|nr:hypothetical protein [Gordonia sp. LSe1-13]
MSGEFDHSPEPRPADVSGGEASRETDWRARRKLDDVFGTDLPDTTSDERDEGHKGLTREWYEANRPPHHE